MTTLNDIRDTLSPELTLLNEHIAATLDASNALMNKVIAEYLKSKGKQIRPILVMLSAKLFGGVCTPRVINAAAAVEMLHNASLIHDDVVDDAGKRRGHATINSVWDNHIAVLIGDFFVSSSLQEALSTGDIRIAGVLASLGRQLSVGEMDQIYNARFHLLKEEAYFQTIGRKTASLFVACVEMGAYAVGVDATDPRLEAMRRYAELLGLCFQIKDDIFDYFDDERIGKPTGNDLREGKVTLPLIHALLSDMPEHDAMLELSRKEDLDTADINTLIDFAKRAGGIDYAYAKMAELRTQGAEILAEFGNNAQTRALSAIFDFIISRHD